MAARNASGGGGLADRLTSLPVLIVLALVVMAFQNGEGPQLLGTGGASAPRPPQVQAPAVNPAEVGAARAALNTVEVKGRAPMTGYSREQFMHGWSSVRGCDMRNRTLARDLSADRFEPGTNDCVVTYGVMDEPYTGKKGLVFTKGTTVLDIDHIYPLGLAWQQGAQQWGPDTLDLDGDGNRTENKREALSQDPDNLLAVDASSNRQKGDSGPAAWLPANKSYRCTYVAKFTAVTVKYGLSMNQPDKDAVARVLAEC